MGTRDFADRIRRMIQDKPEDGELPQLKRLRSRPSLATIVAVVSSHFGAEPGRWAAGRRSDDAARAVAAYLARCRFGHPAVETARALGYRDHSGVGRAVRRVEQGTPELQKTVQTLERRLANP